jgi:hypothetical protein
MGGGANHVLSPSAECSKSYNNLSTGLTNINRKSKKMSSRYLFLYPEYCR